MTRSRRGVALMAAFGVVGLGALWAVDRLADLAPVSFAAPAACRLPARTGLFHVSGQGGLAAPAGRAPISLALLAGLAPVTREASHLVETDP